MGGRQINPGHAVILMAIVAVLAIAFICCWAVWPRASDNEVEDYEQEEVQEAGHPPGSRRAPGRHRR